MKKILLSAISLLILSSCSNQDNLTSIQPIQETPQAEVYTAQDYQAESDTQSNKESVSAIAEGIFSQNFADDVERVAPISNTLSKVESKGGMIFNLLNKSKLAQKVGYLIADYPVRANFNKKSKPDSTPRINEKQIAELKSLLQPGDLILCGNNNSFVHAILYFGNDVIVHSLATKGNDGRKFTGVIKETLSEYLFRAERDKFVVLRYKNLNQPDVQKMADYANKQIGKSYDTLFLMNSDSRFYCTELVYHSLLQLPNPPKIFPHKVKLGWKLITNEDFMDSPDFKTVWTLNKVRPETGLNHE
ncbi:MAG: YiiX/YebB-like N1pC/P60 family cysteine hydrolase [Candidatus Sericytochromatia bacterium]